MSLKGSITTADYLEWSKMQTLVHKLLRDGEHTFALLIATGSYTGLRLSDLRKLRWVDVQQEQLTLTEQKTGKTRTIHIHDELREIVSRVAEKKKPEPEQYLFLSSWGTVYGQQYINRHLKVIAKKYSLNIRFSTHSFRKAFGRRIWEKNNHSEKSLILLGQIFNHSSVAITKRYLGIREQEIRNVYLGL